jgi:GTP pyrophosphokinase
MTKDISLERENTKIKNRYLALLRIIRNTIAKDDIKLVRKAFNIALEAHKEERRPSGEPFIFHPLGVARIVAQEIGLGKTSIISAILHEAVNKGHVETELVEKLFGEKVVNIIKGLSKIEKVDTSSSTIQAENLRKLLLSMVGDARVILIKLADRLDNMRNLNYSENEVQIKTASETSAIYAPLAHRLGLYNLKSELEDLSLKYIEKSDYKSIVKQLADSKVQRDRYIRNFIKPIKDELERQELKFEIKGRPKSIFSIWNKMQKQGVSFDEVYDKFAIRIILDSPVETEKADCWKVYSIITDNYTPNTNRTRDWISVPKSNGYESLHTTVVDQDGKWVEVQIRTARMNEIAEKGLAAHWKYKGVKGDRGMDNWYEQLRSFLETPEQNALDFLENFQLSLYSDEILVFTPNGDLRRLPKGATVLDFAFEIHTRVGETCVGGKVNHKNVTIKHELKNGDHVEIITSKNQSPKTDWLSFVVTSKARSRIKYCLKEAENRESEFGKEILERRCKNWKIDLNDEIIMNLIKHYKLKNGHELYVRIAEEIIDIHEIKEFLTKEEDKQEKEQTIPQKQLKKKAEKKDFLVIDDLIKNVDYKLAKCCTPIMGDDIFGFVTISEGIKIHRTNCPNAKQLLTKYDYRVVNAKWTDDAVDSAFQTSIRILGYDNIGIVSNISDIISKDMKVNMRSINISSKDGMFEGVIQLYVEGITHLDLLIRRLHGIEGITKIHRLNHEE